SAAISGRMRGRVGSVTARVYERMSQTRSTFASGCAEHRTQAALNTACKSGAVTRTWLRELSGWFAATAIGIALTAQVAAVRGDLLFRDGDSLVVALVTRSLFEG